MESMERKELINEIHKSDIFGCFIETGAGLQLSNWLLSQSGASQTIFHVECPYGKEYSLGIYGKSNARAVSRERIEHIMTHEQRKWSGKINTIFVNSFQICADEPNKISHGWYGLMSIDGEIKYYHITLPKGKTREEYIDLVADIGLRILVNQNEEFISNAYIDIITDSEGVHLIDELLESFINSDDEQFLVFDMHGYAGRLEDHIRGKDALLYKGSFNPPHNHHQIIFNNAMENSPSAAPYMMVSTNTFEKDKISVMDLKMRIKLINLAGHQVIINKNGLFDENVKYLRTRHDKEIKFVLGADTINRLIDCYSKDGIFDEVKFKADFQDQNVSFLHSGRFGYESTKIIDDLGGFTQIFEDKVDISSTKIRKFLKDGNLDEIKELVPIKIYNYLSEDWS